MRRPYLVLGSCCLLLSACATEDRSNSAPVDAGPESTERKSQDLPLTPATAAESATAVTHAEDHAHHRAGSAGLLLQRPPGGGRWATDAPLRQGMGRIHVSMAAALPAFEQGVFSAEAAAALAHEVQAQVQFLIANCKLEPAADAQLHLVIGELMTAATALVKDPMSPEGMPRLHQAVQSYGDHFEHPGLHDDI